MVDDQSVIPGAFSLKYLIIYNHIHKAERIKKGTAEDVSIYMGFQNSSFGGFLFTTCTYQPQ